MEPHFRFSVLFFKYASLHGLCVSLLLWYDQLFGTLSLFFACALAFYNQFGCYNTERIIAIT